MTQFDKWMKTKKETQRKYLEYLRGYDYCDSAASYEQDFKIRNLCEQLEDGIVCKMNIDRKALTKLVRKIKKLCADVPKEFVKELKKAG